MFYITGECTARILKSIPEDIKRKMIVINATYPGILNGNEYLSYFNLNNKDNMSAKWLYESLQKRQVSAEIQPGDIEDSQF